MLNKLLIIVATVGCVYPALAQEAVTTTAQGPADAVVPAKMEFGISAGPGYSVFFNQNPVQSPRNGKRPVFGSVAAGISYQYNFTKMIGLHIETNYERKGDIYYLNSSWDGNSTFNSSSAYDRIDYVTVPVMARFTFGKHVRFFVNGGVYAGVTIAARRVMNDTYYQPGSEGTFKQTSIKTDITNDVRSFDAGAAMGLGVLLPIGKVAAFTVEARNNTGFINQTGNTDLYIGKFYNNSTNLLLGITFFLDKFKQDGNLKMSR